jgi:hypothetical protein
MLLANFRYVQGKYVRYRPIVLRKLPQYSCTDLSTLGAENSPYWTAVELPWGIENLNNRSR